MYMDVKKNQEKLKIKKNNQKKKIIKVIKDRIIWDNKNLFELEQDYCKPLRLLIFIAINILNNKIIVIKIKPYQPNNKLMKLIILKDFISNLKKSETWKIQLTIANNFISSKDVQEGYIIHSKGNNREIINYDKLDEVIQELF